MALHKRILLPEKFENAFGRESFFKIDGHCLQSYPVCTDKGTDLTRFVIRLNGGQSFLFYTHTPDRFSLDQPYNYKRVAHVNNVNYLSAICARNGISRLDVAAFVLMLQQYYSSLAN